MDPGWSEHIEAFKRFNRWEDAQLRNRPADYAGALEWIADAWELADRIGAREEPGLSRERHMQEIVAMRAALARADLRA